MVDLVCFCLQPPLPSNPLIKPPPPPPLPDDDKVNLGDTIDANCGEAKLIGVMSAFLQVGSLLFLVVVSLNCLYFIYSLFCF